MTYLIVTPFFPSANSFRGAYIYDFVIALQKVTDWNIVVMMPDVRNMDYVYQGVTVHCFRACELPSGILPGILFDKWNRRSLLSRLQQLGITPQTIDYAHAHVAQFAKYANFIKQRNPTTLTMVTHHGFDVFSELNGIFHHFPWHRAYVRHYARQLTRKIDLHIGVSQAVLNALHEKCRPEDIQSEYTLYNGVNCNIFHPKPKNICNDIFTIGCIANFWKIKDQMTLIRAVELLNIRRIPVKVKFIGNGVERANCEKYIIEHGLKSLFYFENEVFHEHLESFYHSLDIFILPSYWEALGCVYLEAAACGVPFIACQRQGISELLPKSERDFWLIEPQDHTALANKICNFIENRKKQSLLLQIDINHLVENFVNQVLR